MQEGSSKKNVVEPAKQEVKKQGRKVASTLIHEGIPMAGEVLGGIAGAYLGAEGGDPELGEVAGQQLGAYGGRKLADYVGKQTGLGLKQGKAPTTPKKQGRAMKGGTALIDQPFTARQAVNTAGSFIKDPAKTLGFGLKPPRKHAKRPAKKALIGGTALIDQPFTVRQAVDTSGRFVKDPAGTLGFGLKRSVGRPRKMHGTALLQAGY